MGFQSQQRCCRISDSHSNIATIVRQIHKKMTPRHSFYTIKILIGLRIWKLAYPRMPPL